MKTLQEQILEIFAEAQGSGILEAQATELRSALGFTWSRAEPKEQAVARVRSLRSKRRKAGLCHCGEKPVKGRKCCLGCVGAERSRYEARRSAALAAASTRP